MKHTGMFVASVSLGSKFEFVYKALEFKMADRERTIFRTLWATHKKEIVNDPWVEKRDVNFFIMNQNVTK